MILRHIRSAVAGILPVGVSFLLAVYLSTVSYTHLRAAGIRAEIFPDAAKMKKQMSYANAKSVPFVAIVGENEMNEGKAMLKNMETGEQNLVSVEELIAALRN